MALLEYMSETNVNGFSDVEQLILSYEEANAETVNDEIETLNYAEEVCQSYFNLHLSQSEMGLSSEDSTQLYEIASLCADSVGPCVYMAKALYETLYEGLHISSSCEIVDAARKIMPGQEKKSLILGSLFSIYPNPNSGNFVLTGLIDGDYEFVISDLAGREIQKRKFQEIDGKAEISLECENGLYIIKINGTNHHSTDRLIIQR